MIMFKCAWEDRVGSEKHRCEKQCESCKLWYPETENVSHEAKEQIMSILKGEEEHGR